MKILSNFDDIHTFFFEKITHDLPQPHGIFANSV